MPQRSQHGRPGEDNPVVHFFKNIVSFPFFCFLVELKVSFVIHWQLNVNCGVKINSTNKLCCLYLWEYSDARVILLGHTKQEMDTLDKRDRHYHYYFEMSTLIIRNYEALLSASFVFIFLGASHVLILTYHWFLFKEKKSSCASGTIPLK